MSRLVNLRLSDIGSFAIVAIWALFPNETVLCDIVPRGEFAAMSAGFVISTTVSGAEGNVLGAFNRTDDEVFHSALNETNGDLVIRMPTGKAVTQISMTPQIHNGTVFYGRLPAQFEVFGSRTSGPEADWEKIADYRIASNSDKAVKENRALITNQEPERLQFKFTNANRFSSYKISFHGTRGDPYLTFASLTMDESINLLDLKIRITAVLLILIFLGVGFQRSGETQVLRPGLGWALFPMAMLLLIGAQVLFTNSHEIPLTPAVFLGATTLFLILAGLGLWGCHAYLPAFAENRTLRILAFASGLFFYLEANVFTLDWGALDGAAVSWHRSALITILDLATLLTILWMLFKMSAGLHNRLAKIGAILLVVQAVQAGLSFKGWPEASSQIVIDSIAERQPVFSSRNRNVVFILLDMFQGDVFADLVSEGRLNLAKKLSGFTFYRNTVANFPITIASLPSILTGQLYKNDRPHEDFLKEAYTHQSVFRYFTEKGFEVSVRNYIEKEMHVSAADVASSGSGSIKLASQLDQLIILIDLTLFKALPFGLKSWIQDGGKWLMSGRATELFGSRPIYRHGVHTTKEGDYNLIEDLEREFSLKDGPGTFKFFHLAGCHLPVDTDENGSPLPVGQSELVSRKNYAGQCLGALRLALRLVDLLKANRLFDESMIVIASDHGFGLPVKPVAASDSDRLTGWMARAVPLLLLKEPHAPSGRPLGTDDRPVQLSDIPNTIADAIFNESPFENSVSLFGKGRDPRQCRFFANTGDFLPSTDRFIRLTEYCVVGHAWNLTSYSRTNRALKAAR